VIPALPHRNGGAAVSGSWLIKPTLLAGLDQPPLVLMAPAGSPRTHLDMSNSEHSARNSTAFPMPPGHARSDRTAALSAYMALVQHLRDLPQPDFDEEDLGTTPAVTVEVRIVS
jgi:hypothetical protein